MNSRIAVEIGKPNHTLYIQNLNEKAKPSEVKRILTSMLEKYGTILDIIVKRRLKLRGQAFVIFDNEGSAVRALHAAQGRYMFDKPMIVKFARNKSDLISKRDGTYEEEVMKRRIESEPRLTKKEKMMQTIAANPDLPFIPEGSEFIVPNQILFVENLGQNVSKDDLVEIFKEHNGFLEVRMVPGRSDIAFVEYEDEFQSNIAKLALDQQAIKDCIIKVSFAKK